MSNHDSTRDASTDPSAERGSAPTENADSAANPFATPVRLGDVGADYGDADEEPEIPTGPISAFKICFMKKYCSFKGRASRCEYWYWGLAQILLFVALVPGAVVLGAALGTALGKVEAFGEVIGVAGKAEALGKVIGVAGIATFFIICQPLFLLPNLGVAVRRLHDSNMSGWFFWTWVLSVLGRVPLGSLILLIIGCFPETPGPNRFGPEPRRR